MKRFRMKAYLLFTLFLGIFILPGCGGDAGNGHWDQPPVGPTVRATVPGNNTVSVAIGSDLTATFSEAMDPATITMTTFLLQQGTTDISGTVNYSGGTAVFNPDSDLINDTVYTATITTGATDLSGRPLAADYVWKFTTVALDDVTLPTVLSTFPTNGADEVVISRDITATFNKEMDPLTFLPATFTVVETQTPANTIAGSVTLVGNTATFNPDSNLNTGTQYTATVTTNAQDLAGNPLTDDYSWNFTTNTIVQPEITLTNPIDQANVSINIDAITATFNVEMDSLTLNDTTFTVQKSGPPLDLVLVPGNVSYSYDALTSTSTATFAPTSLLEYNTSYTVTVTNGAQDLAGTPLIVPVVNPVPNHWTFTTELEVIPPIVDLGLAATFGIASTAGITNTITAPISHINGDVVFNPNFTCNAVNILFADGPGFGLCDGKAPTIVGTVITPLYPDTTTAQTITDALRAAYLSITPANMPGGTSIAAGTTLGAPVGDPLVEGDNLFNTGVYTSNTSILITGDLTLDAQGDPNATFVFQSASTIGTAPNSRILLLGGAKASNIWWQAGSAATLQSNTTWQGNILAYDDITMVTGATSCGRLFAGAFTDGAFVLDSNVVSVPGTVAGCE